MYRDHKSNFRVSSSLKQSYHSQNALVVEVFDDRQCLCLERRQAFLDRQGVVIVASVARVSLKQPLSKTRKSAVDDDGSVCAANLRDRTIKVITSVQIRSLDDDATYCN